MPILCQVALEAPPLKKFKNILTQSRLLKTSKSTWIIEQNLVAKTLYVTSVFVKQFRFEDPLQDRNYPRKPF